MIRFFLIMILLAMPLGAEEVTPEQSAPPNFAEEKKALLADITAVSKRLSRVEEAWLKAQSEMSRDLTRQQIVAETLVLTGQVDLFVQRVLEAGDEEDKPMAIAVLDASNGYLSQRLEVASDGLRQMFEHYDAAEGDTQVMTRINIGELFRYINDLLDQRQKNLDRLFDLGEEIGKQRDRYQQELTEYAQFMSNYLKYNTRQKDILQQELGILPPDARGALENKVSNQRRLVLVAVDNLKEITRLMELQGMEVDVYNEVIFKTTGSLTEAVASWGAMQRVAHALVADGLAWLHDNLGDLLSRIILFIALMGGTVLLSRLVRRIIRQAVTHRKAGLSTLVQNFFVSVGGNLVVILGLLFALAQIGWDLTPVLTGLGVAGIVVGFALQDTLSNFASGMMILIYRPYDVGDSIEAAGVAGVVSKMNLVSTTIHTFDNQVFVVPNGKIWGDIIKNITSEKKRRVDMIFSLAYSDDVSRAEAVFDQIVRSHPKVLSEPDPIIRLHVLSESSVDFIVRPWVKTDDYWDVYWDITREVKVRFDKEGLTIPFPQRELYLHQGAAPVAPMPASAPASDTGECIAGEGGEHKA